MSLYAQYSSRASNQPPPPAKPLIAPTGFAKLDATLNCINMTVEGVDVAFKTMTDPNAGTLEVASAALNGVMGVVGAPFELLDTGFAMLGGSLNASPLGLSFGSPAATMLSGHVGTPHGHTHPPSLIPPAPPVPLPSMGMVTAACCVSVLIKGFPAARASDLGPALTCVSLAPMFEIYTGSSNTFIGGSRAARLTDMTRHCNPASAVKGLGAALGIVGVAAGGLGAAVTSEKGGPNAALAASKQAEQAAADAAALAMGMMVGKDPGVGPGIGIVTSTNLDVLIGGMPMPDLMEILGPIFKKALGKLRQNKGKIGAVTRFLFGCGDPVDPATGTVYRDYEDFIFDPENNWSWRRHYKSQWAHEVGPFGRGHRFFFGQYLDLRPRLATLHAMDGSEVQFPCVDVGSYEGRAQGYRLRTGGPGHFVLETPGSDAIFHFLRDSESAKRAKLHAIDSPFRGQICLFYDSRGRLTRLSAKKARVDLFLDYDERGLVVAIHRRVPGHPACRVVAYHYDEQSCLVELKSASGGSFRYRYDEGRMVRMENPHGYGFRWEYDHLGRCVGSEGDDRAWGVRFEYGFGETRVTETDGGTWTYQFNDRDQVTKILDPMGGFVAYHIDESGRIVGQSDVTNMVTAWLYDQDGHHYARVDPWGAILPREDVDPNPPTGRELHLPETNLEIQLGVSNTGELHAQPTGSLALPDTLLPFARRILKDAIGAKVPEIIEYNEGGDWVRRCDAWGREETRVYSSAGELLEERDPDGRILANEYGSWFVVKAQTDATFRTTRFEHDHKDRITAITDASGHRVEYPRDLCGRIARVINAGELEERYEHDLAGRVVATYDGDGTKLVEYQYADEAMCQARVLCTGEVHRYAYDAQGMITEASMDDVKVELAYDAGRRVRRDFRRGQGIELRNIGVDGSYEGVLFDRFVTRYEVDGDITTVVTPEGSRHQISWHRGGCVQREHPCALREMSHYDSKGQCTGRMLWRGDGERGELLWHARFEHSPGGDLVSVDDSLRGRTEYAFDAAHRVVGMRHGGDTVRYRYDDAGNLVENRRYQRMVCDARHQLVSADWDRFESNRRYDMESWVRRGVRAEYRYNGIDRLVGIDWDDGRPPWKAAYDGMGRRMWKTYGEERTEYFWEGPRLAAEVGPTGRLRVYVYPGRDALAPVGFVDYDDVDAAPESGRWHSVHFDQVGMVSQVRDCEGEVVWFARVVDAFGEVVEEVDSAGVAWGLRWPGHFFDAETGLQYNRFRYYSAELGRYVRTDPLGQAGGINVYAYPGCPLGVVDVFGLAGKAHPDADPDVSSGTTSVEPKTQMASASAGSKLHGPWWDSSSKSRPPRGKSWGDFIELIGGPPKPTPPPKSHGHHVFMKSGRGKEGKAIAREGLQILREEAGIDPVLDLSNLVHAPLYAKDIHRKDRQRAMLQEFRSLRDRKAAPEEYKAVLRRYGELASSST